jgi:NADPH:quinone reductase-like Zn-dependent oxidoreductase
MPARRRGHRRLCGSQQLAVSEGAGGSPAAGTPENFEPALKFAADGKLKPLIDEVMPLSEAAAAHRRAEAGGRVGKILLDPTQLS